MSDRLLANVQIEKYIGKSWTIYKIIKEVTNVERTYDCYCKCRKKQGS